MIVQLLTKLVEPKSKDEDVVRRERILNILLLGAIVFSAIATLFVLVDVIEQGPAYPGIPIQILASIALGFLALYFFSRAGFFVAVAYIFIGLYFASATYTVYTWGAEIPQGLLTYVLIVIMSGVLISTKFAFVITLITSSTLIFLAYLQTNLITHPNLYWKREMLEIEDAVVIVATFGVIMIISWLFNREIEKALYRARGSEKALKKERDLLEVKVEERTQELRQAQLEKMTQLYRFAEFGRLASGLFHDLVNPLTDVSLNLEMLGTQKTSSLLKRALSGIKRMESFVGVARKQIQKQKTKTNFSVTDEIDQAIQILAHKAREEGVEIRFLQTDNLEIYGNPLKFYQLVTNLLSNGIDAYEKINQGKKKHQVLVELKETDNIVHLTVQDWGCGIPKKHLGKLFDPFFTTKSVDKGTGLGLCICKDIVEKDFSGEMKVKSKKGEGTTFTVEFPMRKHGNK